MTTIALPALVDALPELENTSQRALTFATNLRAVTAGVKDRQAVAEADAAPDDWAGNAQQAAAHAATRFARRVAVAEAALQTAVVAADRFEDRLRRLEERRIDLLERRSNVNGDIEALRQEVSSGPMADAATVAGWEERAAILRARAADLVSDVAAWASHGDDARSDFVRALRGVDTRAEGRRAVGRQADVDALLDGFRAHAGDPGLLSAWWSGLTRSQKQALITESPGLVGNADGLPVADRDEANRAGLYRDLDHLGQREADGQLTDAEERALANARHVRDQLRELRDDIDPVTGDHLANLIVYKPAAHDGDGGVALSLGDPDRARHVSVNVGGLTTELTSLGDNIDKMEGLHGAAISKTGAPVATVFWHDYDAPSGDVASLDGLRDLAEVLSPDEAAKGAAAYADFLDGLRASETAAGQEGRAHLTSIGHSYGSHLVGHSEVQRTPSDDVVLLGSPGVPVATAEELSDATVWVGSKDHDPVTLLGRGGSPSDTDALGYDPAQSTFGGNRFETGRGSHDIDDLIRNHTSYYEGRSLDDVADIMVQRYDDVQPDEARGEPGGEYDGLGTLLTETGGEWLWEQGKQELETTWGEIKDVWNDSVGRLG